MLKNIYSGGLLFLNSCHLYDRRASLIHNILIDWLAIKINVVFCSSWYDSNKIGLVLRL